MPVTNDQIIDAFKQVVDPELFIDIWTLGLIYHFELEDSTLKVKMTFTSIACPAGPQLVEEVRQKALALDGVEKVDVEVVFQPPWEPSDELKGLMGIL
jgi:metal-sulfur cluster biosynthetic enzyme